MLIFSIHETKWQYKSSFSTFCKSQFRTINLHHLFFLRFIHLITEMLSNVTTPTSPSSIHLKSKLVRKLIRRFAKSHSSNRQKMRQCLCAPAQYPRCAMARDQKSVSLHTSQAVLLSRWRYSQVSL